MITALIVELSEGGVGDRVKDEPGSWKSAKGWATQVRIIWYLALTEFQNIY